MREFVYFGGEKIARRDANGTIYYFFADHLGTNRVMTSATGTTQQESTYYPFGGAQREVTSTVDNRWKFTGLERDSESGLDNTLFRKYVSNLARWLGPDPIAGSITDPQSLNRYSYVVNNPTNLTDPLGLFYPYARYEPEWYTFFELLGMGSYTVQGEPIYSSSSTWDDLYILGYNTYTVYSSDALALANTFGSGWWGWTNGGYGAGGGCGGATGSTDSRIQHIEWLRGQIYDTLLDDPECLAFLAGRGAMPLDTLLKLPISLGYGRTGGGRAEVASTAAYYTEGRMVPRQADTQINRLGGFFSLTPRGQATTLLHELGHATGVLNPNDANDLSAQKQNNTLIEDHCEKTLSKFKN